MKWITVAGLLVALSLVLAPTPAAQAQSTVEPNDAGSFTGRMSMLVKRSSRQYAMYQYGVGKFTNTRQPLFETIDEFNRSLSGISRDDAIGGVPNVHDPVIDEQLGVIREKWSELEKIYTFKPYKLLLHKELIPMGERKDDPGLILYVDRLGDALIGEFATLIEKYSAYCERTDSSACNEALRETGSLLLFAESIAADILFAKLDVATDKRRSTLEHSTRGFEATLGDLRSTDTFADDRPGSVAPMLTTIDSHWQQLRIYVDMMLKGDTRDVEIDAMLRAEKRLVEELTNLANVISDSAISNE